VGGLSCLKILAGRGEDQLDWLHRPLTSRQIGQNGGLQMQQLWDTFVMMIPVFVLLTMIFGAGFYIGRVSKRDS
jgi:hypothetical protein